MGWISSLITLISNLLGFSNKIVDVAENHREDRKPVIEERAKKDSIDISQKIEKDIIMHEAELEQAKFKAIKKKTHWKNRLNNFLNKKKNQKTEEE